MSQQNGNMPIRCGFWDIESVLINFSTVLNNEGFLRLEVNENQISIEPAGIRFDILQSNQRSAILECNDQIYFARFIADGNQLNLEFTRPHFEETISIEAKFSGSAYLESLVGNRSASLFHADW